jgi:glycine betaine/choline ABC-type transport system substrate-binding protein
VPVFQRGVLTHPTADACHVVSAKLTTGLLSELDTQVAKGAAPDTVAHKWLSANGPP